MHQLLFYQVSDVAKFILHVRNSVFGQFKTSVNQVRLEELAGENV
jgi:hypothetical protein